MDPGIMDLVGVEAEDLDGAEDLEEDGVEEIPILSVWHTPGCQEDGDGQCLVIMDIHPIMGQRPIMVIIHPTLTIIMDMEYPTRGNLQILKQQVNKHKKEMENESMYYSIRNRLKCTS